MKRYAISDIHGCAQTFKALLEMINFSKADQLYLLGDYIDRGPDSKGVIDHIWKLQADRFQVFCLKGNHEQMLIDAFYSRPHQRSWLTHGGKTTLNSFDVSEINDIPAEYLHWMTKLPHYFDLQQYILVHAGLGFDVKDPLKDETTMLWARKWYDSINRDWLGNRIIVHGHTPIHQETIESMLGNLAQVPVLNIDGGCVFVEPEYQVLCAFDLDDQVLHFQSRVGNG